MALVLWGAWSACAPDAGAVGTGNCTPTTGICTAGTPTCGNPTTYGVNDCGTSCSRTYDRGTCSGDCVTPAGVWSNCLTTTCTFNRGACQASGSLACGTTGAGTYSPICPTVSCTANGPSCYVPYGQVIPGDPVYGFPNITGSGGAPIYPAPSTLSMVGLAAKGNIVVGDYTSALWQGQVLPYVQGNNGTSISKTRPYAIDASDADLGYANDGVNANNQPLFDGKYDQQDRTGILPGTKEDGTPRKFWESSLSDANFQKALTTLSSSLTLDAVLFTNHATLGYLGAGTTIQGSMVARDDGMIFGNALSIFHDQRITYDPMSSNVYLPWSFKRPQLTKWVDCPSTGCP